MLVRLNDVRIIEDDVIAILVRGYSTPVRAFFALSPEDLTVQHIQSLTVDLSLPHKILTCPGGAPNVKRTLRRDNFGTFRLDTTSLWLSNISLCGSPSYCTVR